MHWTGAAHIVGNRAVALPIHKSSPNPALPNNFEAVLQPFNGGALTARIATLREQGWRVSLHAAAIMSVSPATASRAAVARLDRCASRGRMR